MEYSTVQVAAKLHISRDTLYRYFAEGLKPPKIRRVGGVKVRLWSKKDVARLKAYCEARYRKKQPKSGRRKR
jgi:DNA-binding transcriptional MerR regulator